MGNLHQRTGYPFFPAKPRPSHGASTYAFRPVFWLPFILLSRLPT